jgi:hypothetical protein
VTDWCSKRVEVGKIRPASASTPRIPPIRGVIFDLW